MSRVRLLPVAPLTRSAFEPFGDVIDTEGAASFLINDGRTERFHALAGVDLPAPGGQAILSIFRGQPLTPLVITLMERHPLGSQAFVPLNGCPFLAVVAPPGDFDETAIRVFLARGDQGRELIRETLSARGAQVTTLPLYRRRCPDYPADVLAQRLGHFDPDAVVTLSGETLNNLIALCAKSGHNLYDKLLVVPAERVARAARDAGFRHTCVPAGLADPDIVSAVADCLQRGPDGAGTDK